MPRTARIVDRSGGHYHIITRGNNKAAVFHHDDDFVAYLSLVSTIKSEHGFRLFHYVLMNNHVHLLLSPTDGKDLAVIMKRINQNYSLYYKRKYGLIGHLWQDRFKSYHVDDDAYMLMAGIYIELNPVRAGLVVAPTHYPWSSYFANAYGRNDPLIDPSPILLGLAADEENRRAEYRELVELWRQHPVLLKK